MKKLPKYKFSQIKRWKVTTKHHNSTHDSFLLPFITCNYVSSMFVWCYLIIKHHTSWWRLFYYFPHFSIVRYFMMCVPVVLLIRSRYLLENRQESIKFFIPFGEDEKVFFLLVDIHKQGKIYDFFFAWEKKSCLWWKEGKKKKVAKLEIKIKEFPQVFLFSFVPFRHYHRSTFS